MPYSVEAHLSQLEEFTARTLSSRGGMDLGDWNLAWGDYNALDLEATVPADDDGQAQSIHNLAESVLASLNPVDTDALGDDIGVRFDRATGGFMRAYALSKGVRLTDGTLALANGFIDVVVPKAIAEIKRGDARHSVVQRWAGKLAIVRNAIIMTDDVDYWE
jgi:hypothetical protein